MTRNRWLLVLAGLIGGLLRSPRAESSCLLRTNEALSFGGDSPRSGRQEAATGVQNSPQPGATEGQGGGLAMPRETISPGTLQDALLRPYRFPFSRPTPLQQVCTHLKQTLKAAVVLDLAALDRQDVEPDDPVQLELEGVRLKTGLKLLLDQVGLTYRIVAEDNLMIITDSEGVGPTPRTASGPSCEPSIATCMSCKTTSTSCVTTWEMSGKKGDCGSIKPPDHRRIARAQGPDNQESPRISREIPHESQGPMRTCRRGFADGPPAAFHSPEPATPAHDRKRRDASMRQRHRSTQQERDRTARLD